MSNTFLIMKQYSFYTRWQLCASIKDVWTAIHDSKKWPTWWKSIKKVDEIIEGGENDIGNLRAYTIVSPISYELNFNLELTQIKKYELLQGEATGDLVGTGAWHFHEENGITNVTCEWHVATTIKWMNTFSFLLSPLFSYNHKLVMERGAKSLAKKMNCKLVSY